MRKKIACGLVLCSVVLLLAATLKGKRPKPITPGTVIMKRVNPPIMRAQVDPANPFFDVSVDWSLQLDQADQTLYGQMATLLSGVTAVPNDRTNYYSKAGLIASWGGMVDSVSTIDGVTIVNVSVSPVLVESDSTSVLSDYSEQYSIDQNNVVTYLGFTDPEGWAGLVPMTVTN